MNEAELKDKWNLEKPVYLAWGRYIIETVTKTLLEKGINLDNFFKVPAKYRLKSDSSLVDKAFYRPDKEYTDPYNQIEDKVGVRFIVLLIDDIKVIYSTIEARAEWTFTTCKHFEKDREKDPLLFTYQSVHCILRPSKQIVFEGVEIPHTISCEVQIRTLLQHAYAELTHDAIYKTKRTVRSKVHRTVAKSMALIETTDDFFIDVTKLLNYGPLEEHKILERLDGIYYSKTSIKPHTQKSSIIIWDIFEQFINEDLVNNIESMLKNNEFLFKIIRKSYSDCVLYQQSTVLFVYWLLLNHKRRLLNDWPFSFKILEFLAMDLGLNVLDE